jgi:hypothetical protein
MNFFVDNTIGLCRVERVNSRVDEGCGPDGTYILRWPKEDDGSGVLNVLGDGIEPKLCFHSLPNTVSQLYRNEKIEVARGRGR